MGKKRKHLTEEEIWDDSALIQSWNDSYEEYKLYHSMDARGERVTDALAAVQSGDLQAKSYAIPSKETASVHRRDNDQPLEEGELEDDAGSPQMEAHATENSKATTSPQPQSERPPLGTTGERPTQEPLDFPKGLAMGSSRDEALKSLMMSWYWAGYYTGLYEGQTQAEEHATHKAPGV